MTSTTSNPMRNNRRTSHPATLFFALTLAVVFLSWIFDIYRLGVIHPQTGENIHVQSLLSPEGIRWWLRNVFANFTGFSPLGMVITAMFGIGVAQHSGLISACIRKKENSTRGKTGIILLVIFLGMLSNMVGDAGYIILLPIAAFLFHSVRLHPVAGILVAYVSVACGYSANIITSTTDLLLAGTTQEAAAGAEIFGGNTGPLSNYYFMFASTFLIAAIIYAVTTRRLLPALGDYEGGEEPDTCKALSRRERRALVLSLTVGAVYLVVILWATLSSWGLLRGVTGGLVRSPFITGIVFLVSLGIGLMGMFYGLSSGKYRSDSDVAEGFVYPMRLLGTYLVIAFFASQLFACLEYSQIDKCIAIWGAGLLASVQLGKIGTLILFILFVAFTNLFMTSVTAKWAFMAFIFVPVFARLGISPDLTQCAYRIGDSATNAITPFLFYMPLVLTYMKQYNRHSTYGTLLKHTWRYSVWILVLWTAFFVVWYIVGAPVGL